MAQLSLDQLRAKVKAGIPLTDSENAALAFLSAVEGKQRITIPFYDTITIPAAGLTGDIQAFVGNNAGNLNLTSFLSKTQLEQDEYADLIGISFTPLATVQNIDGANAAAIAANRVADVDAIIKNVVLTMKIGTNEYGPYPAQNCGGDGGLDARLAIASSSPGPGESVWGSASNGSPKPGNFAKWGYFVRWPGNKQLIMKSTCTIPPLPSGQPMQVRIAVHANPYYRNFKPETGLHYARS